MPGEWEKLIRLLPEVFDRDDGQPTWDGFSSGGIGGGSGSKGGHSDLTLARVEKGPCRDPVDAAVRKIASQVKALRLGTTALNGMISILLKDIPTGDRVASVPDCLACGELALPRPVSGYCGSCYRAWKRSGEIDRFRFERLRRDRSVNTDK